MCREVGWLERAGVRAVLSSRRLCRLGRHGVLPGWHVVGVVLDCAGKSSWVETRRGRVVGWFALRRVGLSLGQVGLGLGGRYGMGGRVTGSRRSGDDAL